MNSYLLVVLALLIGLIFIGIALIINYQRYRQANSRMMEQLHKLEQDWQAEFSKTPLSELNETQAGQQLLVLEGVSHEVLTSNPSFTKIGDRILYNGMEVELSPILHRILALLIEHRGKAVSKEELIQTGWLDVKPTEVSEAALHEAMRRLKQELKFAQQSEDLILFIPEQGFVLQVNKHIEKS